MSEIDRLLARFIDEWNAGRRPSIDAYLSELSDDVAREDLAAQIEVFLTYGPAPSYDEATLDQLLKEPAVEAAAAAFAVEGSAWPELLPRLRGQAGLSLRDLAVRVLAAAGLSSQGVDKAARRLGEMERGDLDATSVSGRLLTILAGILAIDYLDLARCGTPRERPAAEDALYRRAAGKGDLAADLALLADALASSKSGTQADEVDALFFGTKDR